MTSGIRNRIADTCLDSTINKASSMTYDPVGISGTARKSRRQKKLANASVLSIPVLRRVRQQSAMSDSAFFNTSDEERAGKHEAGEQHFHHLTISTATTGTTFGYQRALINRIHQAAFAQGAPYHAATHKPIFVHDTLMLPGTLANLIKMNSPEDLVLSMTPALLPGVHAHIDLESMRPILVFTQRPNAYVQGMLVFGLRKEARDILRTYYHPFAHCRRIEVDFEACIETSPEDRVASEQHWHLEPRAICAYAWVKSGLDDCELSTKGESCPDWRLGDYLEGKLSLQEPMRIEPSGRGDEDDDGYIGRDIAQYESEPEEEEREVVYSGPGNLDYVRAPWPTAW